MCDKISESNRDMQQSAPSFLGMTPIFLFLIFHNPFTERGKCQCRQLEVLLAERNADDGDAKHDAEHQVLEAYPNASEAYP